MKIKRLIKSSFRLLKDEDFRFLFFAERGFYNKSDDEFFLRKQYKAKMKKQLNLDDPQTMNEKLQYIKLHMRYDLLTKIVDKYEVREYIKERLGEEYLIPLLGVYDKAEDIDFDALPDKFVLKCNHNSGKGMCICKDKSKLDKQKAIENLNSGLAQDYYIVHREWPYKNVKRRIVCEKYMTNDDSSEEFTDYKFMCFNGYVDCVMVCMERNSGDTKFYFFDKDWNLKRINKRGKAAPEGFTIPKPSQMDKMFEIASELSKGFPFVRVDLYQSFDKIYFGELTFFPDSGYDPNILPETDQYFGKFIDLSLCEGGEKNV